MPTQRQAPAQNKSMRSEPPMESPQEITHDIIEYAMEYSRANPGYAALCCIGVGFVLGWKLKPW
jgi:hypothetical protein